MANQWELETLSEINNRRTELGIPILKWSNKLESEARNYWTNPALSHNVIKTCNCPHWTPPNQIAKLLWCDELTQYSTKYAAIVIFNDSKTRVALALEKGQNMTKISVPVETYHEILPNHSWHNDITWDKLPDWIKENPKYRNILLRGKFVTGKNVRYHLVRGKLMRQLRSHITPIQQNKAQTSKSKKPSHTKPKMEDKTIWEEIEKQFGVSKRSFGKKINFVSNPYKRTIIFRDIKDAYTLASGGNSKPAVILAGAVIEELLRSYLEKRGISIQKPLNKDFFGYIQTCTKNGLLTESVSHLSNAARIFRNLVHLSAEKERRHTISKATAIGVVSSIFTIANDF